VIVCAKPVDWQRALFGFCLSFSVPSPKGMRGIYLFLALSLKERELKKAF
jgi:hypothetical protein